ncbi:tryptophan synthase subunit alpha [Sunxiuqinia elliptica]|uniref:Tryptophan synthase alpha chain n=1 Tax=Sunxiuqinia elliptica TaxID=655355 RepID=A0A4R6H8L6_9BACT|nr:tryptophan synthase subunit alpha [Sunxiuqinia elliptica]TDO03936.1 tryptophan synthase alpha chain [Sunxiuqinia elliptica]TDO62218.1 tryptophan synthase alpha chain [Sunxiuqinia elliptica]
MSTQNRINQLFEKKQNNIFSVYFTAGYPDLNDTVPTIQLLEQNGADLIEIGMPFSDPVADGPVIQQSSTVALKNGMSIKKLFEQLANIRESVNIPLILMGYVNPVMQYGVEAFCRKCQEVGIDGLIIPDLPLTVYQEEYQALFEKYGLHNILLITPQTSDERIREIDNASSGFIYMVSSSSTTGIKNKASDFHVDYFERVNQLDLKNPRLIGFGISNRETFDNACKYAAGAIIGSAFVKALDQKLTLEERISGFVKTVVSPA